MPMTTVLVSERSANSGNCRVRDVDRGAAATAKPIAKTNAALARRTAFFVIPALEDDCLSVPWRSQRRIEIYRHRYAVVGSSNLKPTFCKPSSADLPYSFSISLARLGA